jgi:sensor histidine kinase YesM
VVTIRRDSIEIRDTGRGMTPERLAEVREAIARGRELKSNHGSWGRGLAIDVVQHLLPKLFPNALDGATLSIDSTLGVGTVVTIHYPKSIVAAG